MSNTTNPILATVANVIAQSGASIALTGTTAETVLMSVAIPPMLMQAHGRIRLWFTTTATNNANIKTVKAKLNGTVIGAAAAIASTGTQVFHVDVVNGAHLNANYGQLAMTAGATCVQAGGSLAVDTTQPLTVTITGQLATTSDNITLNAYSLETLNV